MVRLLPLLALALSVPGCAGGRQTPSGDTSAAPAGRTFGTVTLLHAAEGCPVLVALDPPGEIGYLMPLELDLRYRKEGLRIGFTYTLSRAHSQGCAKGTPAVLENVGTR